MSEELSLPMEELEELDLTETMSTEDPGPGAEGEEQSEGDPYTPSDDEAGGGASEPPTTGGGDSYTDSD
jgi:hypothetical protein